MRSFEMYREEDETGISGTGKVVEGVIFSSGETVVKWCTPTSMASCVSWWPNFGGFLSIHVHPHPDNKTRIQFSDGCVMEHVDGQFVEKPAAKKRARAKAAS
jgi:hypothetical protein